MKKQLQNYNRIQFPNPSSRRSFLRDSVRISHPENRPRKTEGLSSAVHQLSIQNVYPVYQTRPQKSWWWWWWFVDSQARQETCPWVVQINKHPCLQGNDLENRWKLVPSLLKAIMEVTSSNWIWAQNILNTSEACFIELILALKMFCSIVIYIFVCLDSSLVC